MEKFSLVGVDGNAFCILAYVKEAMEEVGLAEYKQQYRQEATSGDYNNLLAVSLKWLDKCNEKLEGAKNE